MTDDRFLTRGDRQENKRILAEKMSELARNLRAKANPRNPLKFTPEEIERLKRVDEKHGDGYYISAQGERKPIKSPNAIEPWKVEQ